MYAVCDLCGHLPEFPSVNEWNNGAKVIGGFIFVVYVAVSLGLKGIMRNQIEQDGQRME